METINDRIAMLIEKLGITNTAFGKKLKVSQQYISKLTRTGTPSDMLIDDICEKWNVNEDWLRNGIGGEENMFLSEDVKYFQNINKIGTEKNGFKKFCLNMIMSLPDEYWDYIYKEFKKFDKEVSADDSSLTNREVNSLFKELPKTPEEFLDKYPPVDKNSKEVQDWIAKMHPTSKH